MAKRNDTTRPTPIGHQGFTLVEAVVTLVAFSFILTVAFGLFTQLGRVAMGNEQVARSQAGARVAIEDFERLLRSAGAEVDIARGQRNFVWADPFQIAFNANVTPAEDPSGTLAPAALVASAPNAGVPSDGNAFYFPAANYTTGAETIVFTLDSNLDGVVDANDKADDPEERSENPNDYVLYRNTYGSNAGANTVELAPVAVVRGPEPAVAGDFVPPLFTYWVNHDDDRTTPPVLFGDANGDGEISAAEAGLLTPLDPRDLARIERVAVTVTSETATQSADVPENGGYDRVTMSTEVKVRQQPRSSGVIWGVVFKDLDNDGVQDGNEPAISGVVIQSSNGMQTKTNADGQYVLVVSPGTITVTEVDPTGYTSTTSTTMVVDAYPGSYTRVDFGDVPSAGVSSVRGKVFADEDRDGRNDPDERGIANVKIYSDTGEYTFTQGDGTYVIDVPVGVRSISEVDSTGYMSTTPNNVDVEVTSNGNHIVNFGDVMLEETGTVQGYVFEDGNRNGVRESGEGGVPGALIVVAGTNAESDNQGFFSITVPVGSYSVTEEDPPGFTSTTPNILHGIRVDRDQVVTVYFGDMVRENLDFEVIELADTEKALSLAAGDLREDTRGDPDLILGTRFAGGSNNLLAWHNERRNSNTPNSAIFNSTPSFTRANPADVVSLVGADLDGDRDIDLITGLATSTNPDLNVWITGNGGLLPSGATQQYDTDNGEVVFDLQKVDINGDRIDDLIVAVDEAGTSKGHAEIWWGRGGGSYERRSDGMFTMQADGLYTPLNSVVGARAADLDRDGQLDVVLASVDAIGQSSVHVFLQRSILTLREWVPWQSFEVRGEITQLRLADLVEDDQGDVDIIVASATSEYAGFIEVWMQDETGRFGLVTEAGRVMDDQMITGGAPLSLSVSRLDNDIFPDVVTGVRRNTSYEGTVEYALGYGHLLSTPIPITDYSIGAVLTMTESDFNMDGVNDIAVGTQNSSSRGKIFVFFRR